MDERLSAEPALATYEQCPWDAGHVHALYPILNGRVSGDGAWHPIPVTTGIGHYRVASPYFQAIYARGPSVLVEGLKALSPLAVEDDAEWDVWELEGAFAVSSVFASSFGPLTHHKEVNAWLARHGLALEPREAHVEGVAYFAELESGCMTDAVQRLAWLELALDELRHRIQDASKQFWAELECESDRLVSRWRGVVDPDDLLPLPERYAGAEPKMRLPGLKW